MHANLSELRDITTHTSDVNLIDGTVFTQPQANTFDFDMTQFGGAGPLDGFLFNSLGDLRSDDWTRVVESICSSFEPAQDPVFNPQDGYQ